MIQNVTELFVIMRDGRKEQTRNSSKLKIKSIRYRVLTTPTDNLQLLCGEMFFVNEYERSSYYFSRIFQTG